MTTPYRTPLELVRVHSWAPLDDETEVTLCPLLDASQAVLFARLDYRAALAFAATQGATLPTRSHILKLLRIGHVLRPVILPDAAQRAAVPRRPGEDAEDYETRIREPMASLEWCRRHDQAVASQLAAWDGERPLVNVGKHWIAGAPSGRAYLMGWYSRGSWIQAGATSGPGRHDDRHVDYSMCTLLVRPRSEASA